jgi:hypothetical protein
MNIQKFIALSLSTVVLTTELSISAQTTVPYSTSSLQGSTIITNYYDPNAGPDVGPGLPISPLQSRFNEPVGQFGANPGDANGTFTNTSTGPVGPWAAPVQINNPQAQSSRTGVQTLNPVPLSHSLVPPPVSVPGTPNYPYPGLLVMMNGKWFGSDYLYNMPHDIGIVIEVIKPGSKDVEINTEGLRNDIIEVFATDNINPQSMAIGNDPPLPFFHLLIFAYPDENQYTAAIAGRLFEKVKLPRLDFNLPGTIQAITWEKLDLIITSETQFPDQLSAAVTEIAKAFVKRVRYYEEQIVKQNTGFKVVAESPLPGSKADSSVKGNGSKCGPCCK